MANMENMTNVVDIYIMGKCYKVREGLTIMKAMEKVGYKLLRGCGCRGGFCGACATIYRVPGSFKLKVGLACQTVVEDNMRFAQLPYFPFIKTDYDLEKIGANVETIISLYPEVTRCMQCKACTKICPQDNQVMDYIACAIKGDIEGLAQKSFNCVMCGLCASRCPAEIVQYQVGLLGRRLYGRYILAEDKQLQININDINSKIFDNDFDLIMNMDVEQLKKLYQERKIEE